MNIGALVRADRNQAWFYSMVVGTAVFIYVTGGSIINPTNRDWLMFGDAAQHYLGWEFFRHTPLLQWPIGANYPLGMELSSSIVFTDSIPIAAYIAKLLNPILPATFQYFGIWIWLCFLLQAFFAQQFLKFFLPNKVHVYLGAFFVVLSPPLVYRLVHAGYGHVALASHWLILASFCLYLRPGRNDLRWSSLVALCWLIQAYFAPMIAAIWLASLVKRLYTDRERFGLLRSVSVVSVTSFIVMLASGYFMIGSNFNPEGWDYMFRWQPLSFVDSGTDGSSGWSRILHDRAQTDGATEAFSFLGVGVIAMMSMALAKLTLIKSSHHKRSGTLIVGVPIVFVYLSIKQHYPTNFLSLFAFLLVSLFVLVLGAKLVKNRLTFKFYSPLCIAVSLLAIYSLTNRVGFGQRTLFEFPLFPPLRQFTETFRTHGRSIWPLYYLVVLGTVVFFVKLISKKYVSLFLFVTLCFTLIDTSEAISSARQRFTDSPRWTSPLRNPLWKDLSSKYQSIVLIPPLNNDADDHWIVFNDLAAQYHLATNSGNFSRFNEDQYYSWNDMTKDETIARIESINAIYVIFDQSIWDELQKRIINPYFIGRVNNFAVYAP